MNSLRAVQILPWELLKPTEGTYLGSPELVKLLKLCLTANECFSYWGGAVLYNKLTKVRKGRYYHHVIDRHPGVWGDV